MKNRATAVESVTAILRNSCAAVRCSDPDHAASMAEDLVNAIDIEAGATVEDAVLANWPELDEFERRELFGDSGA